MEQGKTERIWDLIDNLVPLKEPILTVSVLWDPPPHNCDLYCYLPYKKLKLRKSYKYKNIQIQIPTTQGSKDNISENSIIHLWENESVTDNNILALLEE